MITLTTNFGSKEFSSQITDLTFSVSESSTRAQVIIKVTKSGDEITVFSENLFPDKDGKISLQDLDLLLQPYTAMWLTFTLNIMVNEQKVVELESIGEKIDDVDQRTLQTTVVSCQASIRNMTAEDWCNSRFLTLIEGPRVTALGFLEYLYFIGDLEEWPRYKAWYDDGSVTEFLTPYQAMGDGYGRIDVSPANYVLENKKLLRYQIKAGNRVQEYVVDQLIEPDVAPVLMFWNSFGVQELAYCTGELKQVASFDRKQARIGRKKMTYSLEEKETFKADTGYLTFPMANWWREVLRSKEINVVPVINGAVDVLNTKPVIIISEKHELSNAPDALPRITFEYEYAERNHNYFDVRQEGRIFDDTFDDTFN